MSEPGPRVLRLELDIGDDRLSGRLSDEAGWVVAFTGWIGLAAAIEHAVAGPMARPNLGDNPS